MRASFFVIFELLIICGLLYCAWLLLKKNVNEVKGKKGDTQREDEKNAE